MKKRFYVTIAMSLVVIMGLTGCGSRTKATDVTVDDGDTIVVSDEDIITEDTEVETDVEVEDNEIVDTEVIGDDAEVADEFVGAEDENIVLYAEKGTQDYCPLDEKNYESSNDTVTATEDIPLYDGDGYAVGYIKNGSNIIIDEIGTEVAWARFENPIKGTDYDYLYVLKDYIDVSSANQFTVTASDVKQKIIDNITGLEVTDYTFVDTPTSDMEVFEFRIESAFEDEIDFNYWYGQSTNDGNLALSNYMTYCIECEKDTDGWISCKVYYKDEIPEDVWNHYYYGY